MLDLYFKEIFNNYKKIVFIFVNNHNLKCDSLKQQKHTNSF